MFSLFLLTFVFRGCEVDVLALRVRETAEDRVLEYRQLQSQMVHLGPLKEQLDALKKETSIIAEKVGLVEELLTY